MGENWTHFIPILPGSFPAGLNEDNDDNYGEDEIDRSKLMPGAFTLDDAEEVLANSIIIAVMGVTGAGKDRKSTRLNSSHWE